MRKELEKVYDPKQVEDRTYQFWLDGGYFHAEVNHDKKPFTIVMPPPNITGQLHMGHALDNTLQDILIRWKRMQGFEALWVPGTDHASIATEAKIVEAMRKEGLSKDDLGRDKFLERAWEWKNTYGGRIVDQLKKLGSSCDWERERFTMDEGCSKAVKEVFLKLYDKGLIYRGERIINWCPHCLTSISEAEVEYEEKAGSFWHIRYPIAHGDGYLEVATTRPETMLGDTALAVHPDDERYKDLVGKTVILPLVNKEIPIVADNYVEMDFGTGVVKITPAHDPNDFEVGIRHNLPVVNILTPDAHIEEGWGKYSGMNRAAARKAIVADLEAGGYLVRTEDYTHNVGTCYRCATVVEPRVSKQWFVKMEPLAKPACKAVRDGETKFIPERFDKIYFHWMENIKDWCISRQLWWGHRIPAYYCDDCGELVVAGEAPDTCPKCGSHKLTQDPDTLDTWFSSALWPFSTLGWPDKTPELDYFYPTNVLVTGYDIIFFWVARMMFSGVEQMNEVPFDTVFIHGIVRDAQGRKMSKSLGNGIDPLIIIDEYGADALRFMLATGNSPGNDMRFSEEKVKASRNFANKLWNATRFILMNLSDEITKPELPQELNIEDKWVLSKFNTLAKDVTENLDKYELGIAVQKLYDFIWDIMCDWYIELTKSRIQEGGETAKDAQKVLVTIMTGTLKLLHPFMPFITEEIWQALPNDCESIMVANWPEYKEELNFEAEEQDFERIMAVIKAIRIRRAEMNVPPSKKATVYIETDFGEIFEQCKLFIERLASASHVNIANKQNIEGAVQVITDSARVFIPMDELIDKEKELARLEKEKKICEKDMAMFEGKLQNPGFLAKAPANVVEAEKAKLDKLKERHAKIEESIRAMV
ncbi:valyl-tRNA synthetase [Hydrogenoanaerobacterium saccharovorans]|uniref:Valine--tRNA ligase n=1 Tax=Hydrogenoanaerobacterium saccharovorans TaxID=474960 RepID=A0A1H8D7Q0_9FIRM|nr:valine--tRNA ligase [Hydrogenoanaerobacterium saccharovorans]RPF43509.1 valyl-tRNA synthetase [Hydrogenoanaerobacterium saccharovorans]SEN02638.1 valyl-tRNA synthetase [Hydrogenoanaerobacterium saccharovorans]